MEETNTPVHQHLSDGKEALVQFTFKVQNKARQQGDDKQIFGLQAVFTEAASIIHAYPEHKSDILNTITAHLDVPYPQVREGVTEALNLLEYGNDDSDIVLAPAVNGDFTVEEIFPTAMAKAINDECSKTRMRPISTAIAMMTAAASVIGSRVEILSGVSNTPCPANLYTLITGNPSDKKSKTTDPIAAAMESLNENEKEKLNATLETLKLRSDLDNSGKEEQKQKLLNNRRDYFWEIGSFSPESVSKHLFQQEERAGFLIYRDEANGLFHYKRWSGGGRGAGGAGDSSTDEFSNLIVTGWAKAILTKSTRVDDAKDRASRKQTMSILGCLQNKYLSEMHDFAIDNNGWTSRWIFFRATTADMDTTIHQKIDTISPVTTYLQQEIIPFLSGVKPKASNSKHVGSLALEFAEDDGAQGAYIDFWNDVETKAILNVQAGIDPAYTAYLRKGQVRVLKFCLLLHLFESLKGAHKETFVPNHEDPYAVLGFKNSVERVDRPISYETLQRAMKLEQLCLSEYQHVAEDAFAAKYSVERAFEDQAEHERQSAVLRAIQQEGSIDERVLKKKMRTRTLSSKVIGETVLKLVRRGSITRERGEPNARWYVVTYVRPLRA